MDHHAFCGKGLNARAVCPGHGPHGLPTLLDDQQAFFSELRKQVGALLQARKSGREVQASVASIGAALKLKPQITRYVGDGLEPQIEKVYQEMTGKKFAGGSKTAHAARDLHRHAHALQSV